MRTIAVLHQITRVTDGVVVRAPHLGRLVDVLFRLQARPDDKRARIQHALLRRDGIDACPRCSAELTLDGFSETRTGFFERRTLSCRGCATAYLIGERQIS